MIYANPRCRVGRLPPGPSIEALAAWDGFVRGTYRNGGVRIARPGLVSEGTTSYAAKTPSHDSN